MTESEITAVVVDRLDGEQLVLDGLGLARAFFHGDPSSVGNNSFDALAGRGDPNMITTSDLQTINRRMRARSSPDHWVTVLDRHLDSLAAIDSALDLISSDAEEWAAANGEELARRAFGAVIAPHRGLSVATKILHLKRPRFFPVLDALVMTMAGINMPTDATPTRRIETAMVLLLHLREQGRRNLDSLRAIQGALREEGIDRSLLRVFDAILWFSHPAAGVAGTSRQFTISAGAGPS